jgi:hypothetical protein
MRHMMSNGRTPRRSIQSSPPPPPQVQQSETQRALISGWEILEIGNIELRRRMIERLGYEAFLDQVGGLVRDRDRDLGGDRQLIHIPFEDDESLMLLKVVCPSTGHLHVLRVPPHMRSCRQAAAWIAGFDNPDDYHPMIEA